MLQTILNRDEIYLIQKNRLSPFYHVLLLSLYFSVTHFCAFLFLSLFHTHAHVYLHIVIFINRTISLSSNCFNLESPTVPALSAISIYLPIIFVYTFSNSSLFCFTLQRYSSQRAEGTSSPVYATFLVLFLFFFFTSISRRTLCIYHALPSLSFSYILLHLCDYRCFSFL